MIKTILITGSTDGIGKLAAQKLAAEGHEVYLHGRNATKLNKVIAELKEQTKNKNVKGFVTDFSDLDAVQQMALEVKNTVPKIDVLINNAGVFKTATTTDKNGLDLRFTVNYLAPFLLTNQLIPLLKKGTAARIVNLSSAAQDSVSYDALSGKSPLSAREAYAQSKLALTMWSFYLAKKLPEITVIAVNPGSLLNTNMVKEAYGKYWAPAEKGGNILFDLAMSEEYSGITGEYFDNDKGAEKGSFARAHPDAYNDTEIEKLIKATTDILRLNSTAK